MIFDTKGKNLKAIEIRYHRSCYAAYTNKRQLELLENAAHKDSSETVNEQAFKQVTYILDRKVFKENETIAMKHLLDVYEEYVQKNLNASYSCHMHRLKQKIISHYGHKVAFAHPSQTHSEYVYSAELTVKDVIESFLRKEATATINEEGTDDEADVIDDNLTYHCGIHLHNIIKTMDDTVPWPPKPEDISQESIDVPDELFNLIAYMMTGTPNPVQVGRLPVTQDQERKILAVAQDLIFVTSRGRLQTVKSLGLAIAIRNITGNREVIYLLNRLGHTVSYWKVQNYEKSLVKKLHGEEQ